MTSKLYEEAIADSKKLKSLLREEVEKDLIEKIKPFMEQALNSEIDSFLMEQEEEAAEQPVEGQEEQPAAEKAETTETAEAAEPQVAEPTAQAAAAAPAAPITPVGGQMNLPLPDESGMITVGFADLFATPATPAVPATQEVAEETVEETEEASAVEAAEEQAAPAEQTPTQALAEAKRIVSTLEEAYGGMNKKGSVGLKEKSDFTYKLVEGYSQLESMKDSNMLRESMFNVLAAKMENLFKLSEKSNKTANSYSGTQRILEGKNMKVHPNTKSLINSLLETLETGYGKEAAHPAPYSKGVGVSKAARAGLPAKPEAVDPGRGKTAMFKHEAEVDEDLLKEVAALEEELEEMEEGSMYEEGLEEMDECGMGYDAKEPKASKEVVIRLVPEVEDLAGSPAMFEEMEEIKALEEMLDAHEELEEADEAGYMEETDEVYEINMEEAAPTAPAAEAAPAAAPKAPATKPVAPAPAPKAPATPEEVAALKENLASNEHLLARSILANKIFAEYDLSRKQKQLVVEYLDRAENVKDATRIYGRIKKQLVEATASTATSEKKTGSLNESVSRGVSQPATAANKIVIGSADRFKQLVAGNKNSR